MAGTPTAATRPGFACKLSAASHSGHAIAGPHGGKWRSCASLGPLCDTFFTDAEKAELKKQTQLRKDEVNVSFFNELKASLEEAVEIKSGVRVPGRVTRYAVADVKTIGALNSRPDIPQPEKRESATDNARIGGTET